MLGRLGTRRTAIALAAALLFAGCIGNQGDEEAAAAPTAADEAASDGNATTTGIVDEDRTTLAMTVGAGVPSGPWVYLGGGEAGVDATENVTTLTVHANLTDAGANGTAPGAGFVGVELLHDGEVHEAKATPGQTSYTFQVDDPATGDWSVQLTPIGADVNREVHVAMLAKGSVPVDGSP